MPVEQNHELNRRAANYNPRSGRSDGSAGPSDRWSNRLQCNQQFETDRKICQKAKSPQCWENQNKRLGTVAGLAKSERHL